MLNKLLTLFLLICLTSVHNYSLAELSRPSATPSKIILPDDQLPPLLEIDACILFNSSSLCAKDIPCVFENKAGGVKERGHCIWAKSFNECICAPDLPVEVPPEVPNKKEDCSGLKEKQCTDKCLWGPDKEPGTCKWKFGECICIPDRKP